MFPVIVYLDGAKNGLGVVALRDKENGRVLLTRPYMSKFIVVGDYSMRGVTNPDDHHRRRRRPGRRPLGNRHRPEVHRRAGDRSSVWPRLH